MRRNNLSVPKSHKRSRTIAANICYIFAVLSFCAGAAQCNLAADERGGGIMRALVLVAVLLIACLSFAWAGIMIDPRPLEGEEGPPQ